MPRNPPHGESASRVAWLGGILVAWGHPLVAWGHPLEAEGGGFEVGALFASCAELEPLGGGGHARPAIADSEVPET